MEIALLLIAISLGLALATLVLYALVIRKQQIKALFLVAYVIVLSAGSEVGQLLPLLHPSLCRASIILSNTFDFLSGFWTCLICYLALQWITNQNKEINFACCLRSAAGLFLLCGVGLSVILGLYIRIDSSDKNCWLRPDTSHFFTYCVTFFLPDLLAAVVNAILLAMIAGRARGYSQGLEIVLVPLVQVIYCALNLSARLLVLEQGVDMEQLFYGLYLLQPAWYSLAMLLNPGAQSAIVRACNQQQPDRYSQLGL